MNLYESFKRNLNESGQPKVEYRIYYPEYRGPQYVDVEFYDSTTNLNDAKRMAQELANNADAEIRADDFAGNGMTWIVRAIWDPEEEDYEEEWDDKENHHKHFMEFMPKGKPPVYENQKLTEMDNSEGLTNIQFEEYCKGKIANLGTVPVETDNWDSDEENAKKTVNVKIAFEQKIRNYGNCKVLNSEDTMNKLDSDGETLEFVTEKGKYINTPMINPITLAGRLEFDKIDRRFYKYMLQYWDEIKDFFESETLNESDSYELLCDCYSCGQEFYVPLKDNSNVQQLIANSQEANKSISVQDAKKLNIVCPNCKSSEVSITQVDPLNESDEFIINKTPFGFTEVVYKGYYISNMGGKVTVNIAGDDVYFDSVEDAINEIDNLNNDPEFSYSDYSIDDEFNRISNEHKKVTKDNIKWDVERTSDRNKVKDALSESAYSDRLGGDPKDFISDLDTVHSALEKIDTEHFGSKLATQIVWDFIEKVEDIINMTKSRYNLDNENKGEEPELIEANEVKINNPMAEPDLEIGDYIVIVTEPRNGVSPVLSTRRYDVYKNEKDAIKAVEKLRAEGLDASYQQVHKRMSESVKTRSKKTTNKINKI